MQTWQHPKSKMWHCIDFAVMWQKDRKRCLDAAVMRGVECHTDHLEFTSGTNMIGSCTEDTQNANETTLKCQFADDDALLATTRDGANRSLQA